MLCTYVLRTSKTPFLHALPRDSLHDTMLLSLLLYATANATNKGELVFTSRVRIRTSRIGITLIKFYNIGDLINTISNSSKGSYLSTIHDIPLRSKLALSASLRRVCIKALFWQTLLSLILRLLLHRAIPYRPYRRLQ